MKTVVFFLICLVFLQISHTCANLKLVQEWKQIEFKFPNESAKALALENGDYVPGNAFIIDTDVQYKNGGKTRIFVTTPRFADGRPITLGVLTKEQGTSSPLLAPYPDYSWHANQKTNCNGITSVLRIAIDQCSRLWVLDTGKIDETQVCSPQLLAFDLRTDQLITRHVFTDAYRTGSLLVTPIVDVRDSKCENTFVYVADITTFAIIVYDHRNGKSWRVTDKYMFPHPPFGTFTIEGETFDLMDGILGMSLSPLKNQYSDRTLYFHALASTTENVVKTSSLRNETLWSDGFFHPSEFRELSGRRPSQAAAEAIDNNGIMYFGLASQNAIACWNTATPFRAENIEIIAQDDVTLQFASGVKIVNNLKGGQELWVVTCRFQKIMTGSMSNDEVNYRILAANVKDLVRGTKCVSPNAAGIANPLNIVSGIASPSYGGAKYQ